MLYMFSVMVFSPPCFTGHGFRSRLPDHALLDHGLLWVGWFHPSGRHGLLHALHGWARVRLFEDACTRVPLLGTRVCVHLGGGLVLRPPSLWFPSPPGVSWGFTGCVRGFSPVFEYLQTL